MIAMLGAAAIAQKKDSAEKQKTRIQLGQIVAEGFKEATFGRTEAHLYGANTHIASEDGKLDANAGEVVMKGGAVDANNAKQTLKSVILTGGVKLLWRPDPVNAPTHYTKISSKRADVDWVTKKVVLTGDVLIETTDPTIFGQLASVSPECPASIVTDEATISFLSEPGQDGLGEPRIHIKGESGRNKIRFIPAQPQKKETEPTASAH
jgi:hypothetical protein